MPKNISVSNGDNSYSVSKSSNSGPPILSEIMDLVTGNNDSYTVKDDNGNVTYSGSKDDCISHAIDMADD